MHRPWSLRVGAAVLAVPFALPLVSWSPGRCARPACHRRPRRSSCRIPLGLGSYGRAFELIDLGRYTFNSLVVVALVVPLTVLVASWAGFAIARLGGRSAALLVAASSRR